MKLRFMRWLTRLSLKHGLYYRWSKVYRWLWERKYRSYQLPTYQSVWALEAAIGAMKWRRDDWRTLRDAISYPQAAWYRHMARQPAGDCDDISLFAAVCMEAIRDGGYVVTIRTVGLLSVPWMDSDGVGGHNVCAYSYSYRGKVYWGHISNWHEGKRQEGFPDLVDVVRDVLRGNGHQSISLGWALASTDLRLVEYGEGKDV